MRQRAQWNDLQKPDDRCSFNITQPERTYENPDQNTDYPGFVRLPDRERTVTAALTLDAAAAQQLFMMTPYCYNTPASGAARLAAQQTLGTEIGFRFLVYRREPGA